MVVSICALLKGVRREGGKGGEGGVDREVLDELFHNLCWLGAPETRGCFLDLIESWELCDRWDSFPIGVLKKYLKEEEGGSGERGEELGGLGEVMGAEGFGVGMGGGLVGSMEGGWEEEGVGLRLSHSDDGFGGGLGGGVLGGLGGNSPLSNSLAPSWGEGGGLNVPCSLLSSHSSPLSPSLSPLSPSLSPHSPSYFPSGNSPGFSSSPSSPSSPSSFSSIHASNLHGIRSQRLTAMVCRLLHSSSLSASPSPPPKPTPNPNTLNTVNDLLYAFSNSIDLETGAPLHLPLSLSLLLAVRSVLCRVPLGEEQGLSHFGSCCGGCGVTPIFGVRYRLVFFFFCCLLLLL